MRSMPQSKLRSFEDLSGLSAAQSTSEDQSAEAVLRLRVSYDLFATEIIAVTEEQALKL